MTQLADGVRQQFTSDERDNETGLDYAHARYYSSIEGRFTTSDPLMASAQTTAPQTWNRYSYGLNNPLKYIDPSGLNVEDTAEDLRAQQAGQPPRPGLNDITVTVTPGRPEFRPNVDTGDTGDNRYFTVYHSILTIIFKDGSGAYTRCYGYKCQYGLHSDHNTDDDSECSTGNS